MWEKRQAVALVAALLAFTVPLYGQTRDERPNPQTTPGAINGNLVTDATGNLVPITQATIGTTICARGQWSTKSVRPPAAFTTKLKKEQMAARGDTIPNPLPKVTTKSGKGTRPDLTQCTAKSGTPACWEEDHLISLQLGGCPDCATNLWPQPWFGTWNAGVKDELENKLNQLVCRGEVSLAQAQQAIARDWIAAYKQFIGQAPSSTRRSGSRDPQTPETQTTARHAAR